MEFIYSTKKKIWRKIGLIQLKIIIAKNLPIIVNKCSIYLQYFPNNVSLESPIKLQL